MITLITQNGSTLYYPAVEEGITLQWQRKGAPGTLRFTVLEDSGLTLKEGNPVKLTVDGITMFYGFVFRLGRDRGPKLQATAYDQLRYLKNKDTVIEEGLKASDLLKRLAEDFRLNLGTVEDTGYTLETVVEENQTLFDMLQNALDETLLNTGQLFVLYDEAGSLTLRNINSMGLNLLIDAETGENFSYESEIDTRTYNKIKLAFNNQSTGKRELYIAQDGDAMNRWGMLQYFDQIDSAAGAAAKADALLKLYNRETRRLTVKGAFGDPRVRAGSAVMVSLQLGDVRVNRFMVAEKVTHTFKGQDHRMDLTLIGGNFIA